MSFPFISQTYPLILASASPRRKRLLTQIKLPFQVVPSDVGEEMTGCGPEEIPRFLAEKKANRVYSQGGGGWVLGADTVVVIENRVLGKPQDRAEAREMLRLLSGKAHAVITGFCLLNPSGRSAHAESVTTAVRFKRLEEGEIASYADTGEPFGKAGAYAIQGVGSFMVESISGSYSNVVGLPLCSLVKALIRVGGIRGFPISSSGTSA